MDLALQVRQTWGKMSSTTNASSKKTAAPATSKAVSTIEAKPALQELDHSIRVERAAHSPAAERVWEDLIGPWREQPRG